MDTRRRELWIVGLNFAGVTFAVLGAIAAFLLTWVNGPAGIALMLSGLALVGLAGSAVMAFATNTLGHVWQDRSGGNRYERLRRERRLRIATILLRLLLLAGMSFVIGYALLRFELLEVAIQEAVTRRAAALMLLALATVAAYALHQSLRVPLAVELSDMRRAVSYTLLAVGAAGGIGAGVLGLTGVPTPWLALDLLALAVTALVLTATTVAWMRGLPGLIDAIADPGRITAGGYTPDRRLALMPTLVAFTILGGFVLLLIVLSAGLSRVLQQAGESRLLLSILLLMAGAVIAGVVYSLSLSRQTDRPTLYREATPKQARDRALVLGASLPFAALLLGVALVLQSGRPIGAVPESAWLHATGIGLLIGIGPYGFYVGALARRTRLMEERFPDLLRDLASSHQGGLTLSAAVQIAARGDYGMLSPEIEKMADQLTWGISFQETLERLAERVPTPLIRRTVSLILEASKSGGNTIDVLMAAARDARELKTLERQRRLNMSVYTLVIYVTFFVFLFVVGVLYAQFVPEILRAEQATKESGLTGIGALDLGGIGLADYRMFYFLAGVVQAIGNGVLAGVMGSSRAVLGLRHAFWMVLFTYVAFGFMLV